MDADIDPATAEANDFAPFLDRYPTISRIGFNGQTAAKMFQGLAAESSVDRAIDTVQLPSTSPAYASIPVAEKLERWRVLLEL